MPARQRQPPACTQFCFQVSVGDNEGGTVGDPLETSPFLLVPRGMALILTTSGANVRCRLLCVVLSCLTPCQPPLCNQPTPIMIVPLGAFLSFLSLASPSPPDTASIGSVVCHIASVEPPVSFTKTWRRSCLPGDHRVLDTGHYIACWVFPCAARSPGFIFRCQTFRPVVQPLRP